MKHRKHIIASIIGMHCPGCRTGHLFRTGSFSFKEPFDMPDRCEVCRQSFMPEPGFYYGAMFISYILWGWLTLAMAAIFIWGLGMSVYGAFALILVISAICFIWLFRISRSIWIHIAGKAKVVKKSNDP